MRIEAGGRRRVGEGRGLAALLLGLLLCVPALDAKADDRESGGAPSSPRSSAPAERSEKKVAPPARAPRPETRSDAKRKAFQPSRKIPADVPSDFPTDI